MRLRIAMAAVVLLFVGRASPLSACSCIPPPPPREAAHEAQAVFFGRAVAVDASGSGSRIRFQVFASWKGVESDTVTVGTGPGGGMCGFDFTPGQIYVVYAYRKDESRMLGTSICTRTHRWAWDDKDPAELGPVQIDRLGSLPWTSSAPQRTCRVHSRIEVRLSEAAIATGLSPREVDEFRAVAAKRFPRAALLPEPAVHKFGPPAAAWVCPACREAARDWSLLHGANCRPVPEAVPVTAHAPDPYESDGNYRRRYPRRGFAVLIDDGRRFVFDSIEDNLTRSFGDVADTSIFTNLDEYDLNQIYEAAVRTRVFSVPSPAPFPGAQGDPASLPGCRPLRIYVRADTLVRKFTWHVGNMPARSLARDEWKRLGDFAEATMAIVLRRTEVKRLPSLPASIPDPWGRWVSPPSTLLRLPAARR
jgi:hypothetical protein